MKVIDNINTLLKDELIESIKKGSKMTIAASCFSMCASGDNSLYLPLFIFRYSDGETPTCL